MSAEKEAKIVPTTPEAWVAEWKKTRSEAENQEDFQARGTLLNTLLASEEASWQRIRGIAVAASRVGYWRFFSDEADLVQLPAAEEVIGQYLQLGDETVLFASIATFVQNHYQQEYGTERVEEGKIRNQNPTPYQGCLPNLAERTGYLGEKPGAITNYLWSGGPVQFLAIMEKHSANAGNLFTIKLLRPSPRLSTD